MFQYPSITAISTREPGRTVSKLSFIVRDYKTDNSDGAPGSHASLFNLQVEAYAIVGISPIETLWACQLIPETRLSEFNSTNESPSMRLHLTDPFGVIVFFASARNGRWQGMEVLRKDGQDTRIEETLYGNVDVSGGVFKMSRKEVYYASGRSGAITHGFTGELDLTPPDLRIPIRDFTKAQLATACKGYPGAELSDGVSSETGSLEIKSRLGNPYDVKIINR